MRPTIHLCTYLDTLLMQPLAFSQYFLYTASLQIGMHLMLVCECAI